MVSIPKYSKFTSFLSFSFYCCHHSTQIEIWIIRLLLFAFFPIAEWNCQQLAANTTYKQCWMWAMGNKLLMYAMWNSCHSISAYVWCVLYTQTHTSSDRSQWCVMCELLLTTSTQWCEHNVNTQLPATNRCLYVCAQVCKFSFSNVVGFFSFQ